MGQNGRGPRLHTVFLLTSLKRKRLMEEGREKEGRVGKRGMEEGREEERKGQTREVFLVLLELSETHYK